MNQTSEQRETGVQVVKPFVQEIEIRPRAMGKAQDMRAQILASAHEELALSYKHLVDGLDWLAVTDLGMSEDKRKKNTQLKKQISDLVDGVEEMRKAYSTYVHSPTV